MNNLDYLHIFTPYFSTSYSQKFLLNLYNKQSLSDSDTHSYNNCYSFISFIESGIQYFKQLQFTPIQIKPLLLYYGTLHLIKACILIVDPLYPESTAVLAHGVSARKKKKQNYEFLTDEIKIQRYGLFTHMAERMFHMKHLEGNKFSMVSLLEEIPELKSLFYTMKKKNTFMDMIVNSQAATANIPISILDYYHMTAERFQQYIMDKGKFPLKKVEQNGTELQLHFDTPYHFTRSTCLPFRYNFLSNNYSITLNRNGHTQTLPDLMILYLLLYNLSMISRYETEWWSDLFKSMPHYDLPFIESLLQIAENKIPMIIFDWLATFQDSL